MKLNIVAPSVGESITEVRIFAWRKKSGDAVKVGEVVVEIESDKATVEVVAEANGELQIVKEAGETVPVGEVLGMVDDTKAGKASAGAAPAAAPSAGAAPKAAPEGAYDGYSPAAKKIAAENSVTDLSIKGTGRDGRVTKGDVMEAISKPRTPSPAFNASEQKDPANVKRIPMSTIRKRIAERLVQAQHTAAILTTFNEVDMTEVNKIRAAYKEKFKTKYGVNLGFMSFFTKACVAALKEIPDVNSYIDRDDVMQPDYINIGVAVGSDKGLVVPVVKNVQNMSFAQIEQEIVRFAGKAKDGKLTIAEMSGGTFTISNGGTYGSLMSTPILNPPQSGILGMHKIQDRPMAVGGKVEIRPMMYLALSYDHRIIDGKGAVTFLVTVKDHLENPEKLGLDFINELK
ncbi:MAG TPA: 2-oxoglutarate dehydrogenase complex dihydrolipoyllysine-residue succinyltransferase [Bdellovibrionota bacterium]|jgi:2-oxoglutarate dehydrogenase E2 component (dihydrolipoamide succinyltransferase)|nr:2-oxoglutarate dehydrogenase complex dihydrolipoyllysine-residue succinyltransferase [Bdellovibrionota bacterium]